MSNMVIKDNQKTYSDNLIANPGIQIGLIADFPVQGIFSFETGLILSSKGYRTKHEETYMGETYSSNNCMSLMYLEVPLAAKASYGLGEVRIYGNFGPYLGMGISGKYKWEYSGESDKGDEK